MSQTARRPRMSDANYRKLLDLAEQTGWAEILAVVEDSIADKALAIERAGGGDSTVASFERAAALAGFAWTALVTDRGRDVPLVDALTPSELLPPEPPGDELTEAEAAELDSLPSVAQSRSLRTLADALHAGTLTPEGAIAALEPDPRWEAQPC